MQDRQRRKTMEYSRQARDWFTVLAGVAVVLIAMTTIILMAIAIASCSTAKAAVIATAGGESKPVIEIEKLEI